MFLLNLEWVLTATPTGAPLNFPEEVANFLDSSLEALRYMFERGVIYSTHAVDRWCFNGSNNIYWVSRRFPACRRQVYTLLQKELTNLSFMVWRRKLLRALCMG